jgi:glucosamine--fructose-6-phosphate aminotransferase (isomerizing)
VLALEAGPELSVPASKTYTATLVLIAMLSQALDPDRDFASSLHRIPAALEVALRQDLPLGPLARALDGPRLAVLGRGFHLATAQEIALKIMETSYSIAEARSLADFLHGPLAIIEPGFPVLLIEAAGPTLRQMRTLEGHLRQLGAQVAVISDRRIASTPGLAVRTGLPEALTPLPFAVVGQRVALQLARDRGIDPDRPRSLQKVTITR